MHGSNRLGGNSLSDLLVFGRRAGLAAAEHAAKLAGARTEVSDAVLADAAAAALAPFDRDGGENPYAVQHDLQSTMHDLVGIIRTRAEMEQALERIAVLKQRVADLSVEGHRQYNPGWHLALDLPHLLLVSECIARAALEREESRGGHTRDDFPGADDDWARINLVLTLPPGSDVVQVTRQPLPQMPGDLAEIFES
jgi:succinate dehydrogenase / fumarate reductase flavoprotein subunit